MICALTLFFLIRAALKKYCKFLTQNAEMTWLDCGRFSMMMIFAFSGEFPFSTVPAFISGYLFSRAFPWGENNFHCFSLNFPLSQEFHFLGICPVLIILSDFWKSRGSPQNFKYPVIMHIRTIIRFRILDIYISFGFLSNF